MKYFIISIFLILANMTVVSASPLRVIFEPTAYTFDNADLRDYNASTYQTNKAVQSANTDDRVSFVLSTLTVDYMKQYLNSEFFMTLKADGYWGNDNLGKNSKSSLMFDSLYAKTSLGRDRYCSVGRQKYGLGDSTHEYIFNDIIDGIVLNWSVTIFDEPLKVNLMGDVTGIASSPSNSDRFSSISKDSEQVQDFQGDTMSMRGGLKIDYSFVKLFGYYVRYAASTQGGDDISENGLTTLNKVDGDYIFMYGARLYRDFDTFGRVDGTFALSDGYDFQYSSDKRYQGNALVLNYEFNLNRTTYVPVYYINNLRCYLSIGQFSENYCGMTSDGLDSLLLKDYYGYQMSAVVGPYHFIDYARSATSTTHADVTVAKTFSRIGATVSIYLFDVDYSVLILNDSKNNSMGQLHSLCGKYTDENLTLHLAGEVFIPGNYYTKVGSSNPFVPNGKDPFYCISAGAKYIFTFID